MSLFRQTDVDNQLYGHVLYVDRIDEWWLEITMWETEEFKLLIGRWLVLCILYYTFLYKHVYELYLFPPWNEMKCDFEDAFWHWLCDMVSLIKYVLKQARNWMVMSIVSDKGTVQMDLLGAVSWPVSACFVWAEFEDTFPASPCLSAIIQCFLVIIYK